MEMFSYEENEEVFLNYIEKCREEIRNLFFSEEELKDSVFVKKDLLSEGKITNDIDLTDAIKIHRNNLIDIKLNHTMRIVGDVYKMSLKMNLPIDFTKILKISALLHDYGRFPQAVRANSFNNDKKTLGMYHADYGYRLLYINNEISNFKLPRHLTYTLLQPVRYHQLSNLSDDLTIKFTNPKELNVGKITGLELLNDSEKMIVAALVQMIRDVDMLDILYQNVSGEFPVVRSYVTFKRNLKNNLESLEYISKYWNVDKKEIMEYNGLETEDLKELEYIKIPVKNMNLDMLRVDDNIRKMYFNNEKMELTEIMKSNRYTFITGMWWRLNHFLNNITFVSNLEVIEENKLLDSIYNSYPDEYKPLVIEAFEYAKEVLIEKRIKDNKGEIYLKRTIK